VIAALALALGSDVAPESDFYEVDWLTPPDKAVVEVGGMDFLPDRRLIVSTRRGQVWIVENPLAENAADARFHLFAEGLQEGLGLSVVDGKIYVLQRGELSRLVDDDGDGTCDRIETVCNTWGLSGHYHEFAFGLPVDREKNFYLSLNVSFGDPQWWHGRSKAPWRGWVMQVTPAGELVPYACGFRSPCGLGMTEAGELLETDNQGDWMPTCPIYHVKPGRFYGHPASLAWTKEYQATNTTPSDTVPPEREREPAAVWLPYKWVRSAGNLVADTTGGKFGPFAHEYFVAELTNGMVVRTQLEKVRGEYQGCCFLFRRRVGSSVRVKFAPDGTLFAGLTNRGWGGLAPSSGVARLRWTGKTPFEMKSVHLLQDGFDIGFTKPVDAAAAAAAVDAQQYHYDWWWEYGCPERGNEKLELASQTISPDGLQLTVHFKNLRAGEIARVLLPAVRSKDGEPLLHDEFDYTVNQLPGGPVCTTPVARLVPPPPARQSGDEGWLRLCYSDALGLWNASGWTLCDAEVLPAEPKKLATKAGVGALVNTAGTGDFVSKPEFGDVKLHAEFMLPEGGGGGVMLMGRYEIRLSADARCGAIPKGESFAGEPPALECFKGPGEWHDLDLVFRAPRFDASGAKTKSAFFEKVLVDDILLHESLEIPGPTEGGFPGEAVRGPLRFRGDLGAVALGGIKVRPLEENADEKGFRPLFDGEGLEGWRKVGEADWKVEDGVLTGSGKKGFLATERADFRDFELAARMKVSDGGDSGIFFRAGGEGEFAGYEAAVNSSYPADEHTGSLAGLAPVKVHLVAPETWFDYRVRCEEEKEGTRIRISIDGVLITEFLDRERRFANGRIAIEQHHEGSVVEVKALAVREIGK
jgi:glucose/arabinose dehydrogenase